MFVEIGMVAGGNYLLYKYLNFHYDKFKKKFEVLIDRIPSLKNNQGELIRFLDYSKTDYGYELKLELPLGINSEKFEEQLLTIKEGLKTPTINLKYNNRFITLQGIKNYKFRQFEPVKLPPNKILISEFMDDYIIVDLNKFPHVLVCGDTGTGKTRIIFTILTNLINSSNRVNIHLLQVRKNDLAVFKNCKQVKTCSRTLEEVLTALEAIDRECQRREDLIDIEKGYLNIEDYNKKSGNILNYIYAVVEEFSFLNVSKADRKEEKRIKYECMQHLKNIVNAGRSSGVFLITSLQKPTSDSIPTDIKAMLTTRIALNIKDSSTCRVVMDNDSAVNLDERQLVCRTKDTQLGYSLTIDFPDIKKYTKDFIVKREFKTDSKIKPKKKNDATDIYKVLGV